MSNPRKRYRPKPVNPNVLALAGIGQSKLTPEDQEARIAPPRLALEQITKGQASQADWQAIFDVINMLQFPANYASVFTSCSGDEIRVWSNMGKELLKIELLQ